MNRFFFIAVFMVIPFSYANNGVMTQEIKLDPKQAIIKIERIAHKKGIIVFEVIDHAQAAKKVGFELGPTFTIILGNPKVGTPLMLKKREVALDLPMKIVLYTQEKKHFLVYNDPVYLEKRYKLESSREIKKIQKFFSHLKTSLTKTK